MTGGSQGASVLAQVRAEGGVTSSDVGRDEPRSSGGWWQWHPSKTALEYLWRSGALAVTGREGFRKRYDLTERVVPAADGQALAQELESLQMLINEPLPDDHEMMQLGAERAALLQAVGELEEQKRRKESDPDDKLAMFRQQANLVSKKKEAVQQRLRMALADKESVDRQLAAKAEQFEHRVLQPENAGTGDPGPFEAGNPICWFDEVCDEKLLFACQYDEPPNGVGDCVVCTAEGALFSWGGNEDGSWAWATTRSAASRATWPCRTARRRAA